MTSEYDKPEIHKMVNSLGLYTQPKMGDQRGQYLQTSHIALHLSSHEF